MPFCNKCGSNVTDTDQFCAGCGARNTSTGATADPGGPAAGGTSTPFGGPSMAAAHKWLNSLDPRTASLICYIPFAGWIGSIIVLATERFRHDYTARFHAFQGLYLFVAYLIVDNVIGPIFGFDGNSAGLQIERLLKLVLLGTWIFMLVRTSQGTLFKLPVFGELADRSVSEQR